MKIYEAAAIVSLVLICGCASSGTENKSASSRESSESSQPTATVPVASTSKDGDASKAESSTAATQPAAAVNERGMMTAVMVNKGPVIDGALNDPLWQKCPPIVLGKCENEDVLLPRTTVRVLFDPVNVYIAFECDEPNTDSLSKKIDKRDGNVWSDDDIEVFISGDYREGLYHFIVNPRGTLFDAKDRESKYDSTATVKTSINKNKNWIATMSIPMKEIGAFVGDNQTWVLNLNRTKAVSSDAPQGVCWSWSVLGTEDFHLQYNYGRVVGVNVPKRQDGVTRVADLLPPPPTANKGKQEGSVIVYNKFGDVDIPSDGKRLDKGFDVSIRNSPGLKIAFLARGGGAMKDAALNIYDVLANDNTTSWAYAALPEGQWVPVVYRCDKFRYNGRAADTVGKNTAYNGIRFFGMAGSSLSLRDLVVYRGDDVDLPLSPTKLSAAMSTGQDGKGGVALKWDRASDNTGIASYIISRAGADGKFIKIAQSPLPEYVDLAAATGKNSYRIAAVDFSDNIGKWSNVATVDVPADFKGDLVKPSQVQQDRSGYAARIKKIHDAGKGKVIKGRVLCYGDSLTHANNYGYAIDSHLGRYDVIAKGYPSQKTSYGLEKIAEHLKDYNPEFCLILFGTNNGKSDNEIAAAMDDLLAIADSCEKNGTVPVIATIPPRGFKDPDSAPEAKYNESLIKTCRAKGIPVCYLFEEFQAAPDRAQLLAGDGVHMHKDGFDASGRAWKKTMDHVLFTLLDQD